MVNEVAGDHVTNLDDTCDGMFEWLWSMMPIEMACPTQGVE